MIVKSAATNPLTCKRDIFSKIQWWPASKPVAIAGRRCCKPAGFISDTERPQRADLDKDFPNKLQKPVDTAYGPYVDDFPASQHKLGPFDPIRAKIKELAAQAAGR